MSFVVLVGCLLQHPSLLGCKQGVGIKRNLVHTSRLGSFLMAPGIVGSTPHSGTPAGRGTRTIS